MSPKLLNRPDPDFLVHLDTVNRLSLIMACVIGSIILAGWQLPAIASILPHGWSVMQSTTAACALLGSLGMLLRQRKDATWAVQLRRASVTGLFMISLSTMLEHTSGLSTGIATLMVADGMLQNAHQMSVQSASCFLLLALAMSIPVSRQDWMGKLLDSLILLLLIINLVFIADYLFDALYLIRQSRISACPHRPCSASCC